MHYSLRRTRDGAGDSGSMSRAIWIEDAEVQLEEDARPRIGVRMMVGSYHARTMQYQDYWCTTDITKILEEKDDYVKFETGNSIYEWEAY